MTLPSLVLIPLLAVELAVETAADRLHDAIERLRRIRSSNRARVEAELDRQQMQLRSTILRLAEQLGADAHEARKALIRESFLASRSDLTDSDR
jgi:vacuolar-type H+-ATPase subunit H